MEPSTELYLALMKNVLTNVIYRDAPIAWFEGNHVSSFTSDRERSARWPNVAHTMVSAERLDNVQFCLETAIVNGVPGDFIETGVWRGGVCIFARAVLRALGVTDRRVWVADSFAGIPVTPEDGHPFDIEIALHEKNDVLAVSEAEVRDNFHRYQLLDDQVAFLGGWFADTLPTAPIEALSVLRLDGDLYSSTMDALTGLYHKLSPGGFVIVDDYGIPGCRVAVHEFREQYGITDEICFIDPWAIYWQKSGSAAPA